MILLIWFILRLGSSLISIQDSVILYSFATPNLLLSQLSNIQLLNISNQTQESLINDLTDLDYLFLIDFTYSKSYTPLISDISRILDITFLSPYCSNTIENHKSSIHLCIFDQVQSIISLAKFLSINKYIILSSANYYDLQIANELKTNDESKVYESISYQEIINIYTAENIAARMIKARGIRNLIIIDHVESLNIIESALITKKLATSGAIFIYPSKNIWQASLNGSLIIVESGLENSTSEADYEIKAVENAINFINSKIQEHRIFNIEKATVLNILEGYNIKKNGFSIVNIQGSNKIIVGNITIVESNNSFNYISSINNIVYYPGNITVPEVSANTKIVLSIANGTLDTNNTQYFPEVAYFYEGAIFAVASSNAKNDIPNFYIDFFPTNCGITSYDPYWFADCFANYTGKMGTAYLTNMVLGSIIGNYITLEKMGVTIPQICPLNPSGSLDTEAYFPNLLFLGSSFTDMMLNQIIALRSLGYNSIVVLISSESEALGPVYEYLVSNLLEQGFTIMNTVENRYLPATYTRDDYSKYKSIFQHVKDTLCNLYIITLFEFPAMILEGLYDIGLRQGEFLTFGDITFGRVLAGIEEPYYSKRKELINGQLILDFREYVGELGQEINAYLSAIFPQTTFMCLTYDSVSIVKEAIIYLLSIGEDYENPKFLNSAMRNNKIVGCLGNIVFENGQNSRTQVQYTIQQVNFNTTLNTTVISDIGYVNRFSSQLITIIDEFDWPTGSLLLNIRPAYPCPFDEFLVVDSPNGRAALYGFSVFFFLLALIVSIIAYTKTKSTFEQLNEIQIISFADMWFFLYFPIQFFQFITMGPDQDSYKYALQNFQVLISLDFNLYFNVTFEKFWMVFYAILIFSVIWIILCILHLLNCTSRLNNFYLCRKIEDISIIIVPVFGHMGFLSIFSMLMNIYLCNQQIDNSLTKSFLQNDCTKFCYTDYHQILVGITTIVISIYLSIIIISRSYLEAFQPTLHLQTKEIYLYTLTIFQILLVILNKTLKTANQTTHGIVCTLLLSIFLVYTILLKPYNYQRANISQYISLSASIWAIGTSAIFRNYSMIQIWVIIEFFGIIFILIIGMMRLKKANNFLIFEKGINISELFFFQCFKIRDKYEKDLSYIVVSSNEQKYREASPEEDKSENINR